MPFAALVFAGLTMFLVGGAGWEYTNRSQFCGESCHTMPPQYESWQVSSHSRVNCVDCHIGRAYIATQFSRKAQDISHVIEFIGAHYEVPIYSKKLRPGPSRGVREMSQPAKILRRQPAGVQNL